ncbi:MAG TPA: Na-translocating system protein MpsC family protein [Capillimicrobium sp.]|nr:Na-translocating system protein MpsC family protein [Capillimicrobium sp.]
MNAALSNAIVRTYREALGRGPTRARCLTTETHVLLCVLQDTLTPAERRLVTAGLHDQVRATRAELARTMEPDLRAAVEQIAERRVQTVVSGFNPWHDVATEAFLFEAE